MQYYNTLENHRKQKIKLYKKYNLIIIILFISVFVLMIINFYLALITIGLIVYFFYKKSAIQKEYRTLFKEEVVNTLIRSQFDNVEYIQSIGINVRHINNACFFNRPNRYTTEDLITGTYDGVSFKMADVHLEKKRTNGTSEGYYDTYIKGKFILIDFERNFNDTVKIIERKTITPFNTYNKGLVEVELESIDFNEKFKVFSTTKHAAFYMLTPQLQEQLLHLESCFNGDIYVSFMQGKCYIVINDNSNSFEHKITEEITKEHIDNILYQINLVPNIIKSFKINTSVKFTEGKIL